MRILTVAFFLFQKNSPGGGKFGDREEKLKDDAADFSRIRCPLCRWQPNASSRWYCGDDRYHDGCGTGWNTFDTRGRCPGCAYLWKWTECLRCGEASPHEDWYKDEADRS